MEFSIKSGNPEKQRTACLIIGITEPRRLTPAAKAVDEDAPQIQRVTGEAFPT